MDPKVPFQELEQQGHLLQFQKHLLWFRALRVVLILTHPSPLEVAQVRR